MLRERTMGHVKLLLTKAGSLMRDEVDWVRVGLEGVWKS